MSAQDPIPPTLREGLEHLDLWLEQESAEDVAEHVLPLATRWVLEDVEGLDVARYTGEAKTFVLATDIWDRVLKRFPKDVTYWMSQRLLVDEAEQLRPDGGEAILASARSLIAERADLLETEGFEQVARAFRRLLDETAGGSPPADLIWSALALRLAEPYLQDATNPVPADEPTSPAPPEPAPE
jgi:hypothetical protein